MTGHAPGNEVLLGRGKVGNAASGSGGGGPRPGGEFVDEVVSRENKLFGGDLTGCAESGGVTYGG